MSKKISISEGLNAIFSSSAPNNQQVPTQTRSLPVNRLIEGRYQTRQLSHDDALKELVDSVRQYGILQAILVRALPDQNYEIIAGHRQWHAAKIAGLAEVPVEIKSVPENVVAAFTVIENIQRENLNPIEEAQAYQKLIDEFKLTHEEVAKRIGKPRASEHNQPLNATNRLLE